MPVKIYPDRKWMLYWKGKRNHCKEKGIPFELSRQDQLTLIERAVQHPSRDYHLGRIDHDKGYTLDNVEWQSMKHNLLEQHTRHGHTIGGKEPIEVPCDYCSKPVLKVSSQLNKYPHTFCCREHHYQWMRENH